MYATSIYVSYETQEQITPLYQQNKTINMYGYSIDFSHTFSEKFSASIHSQQSNAEQSKASPSLSINAEQQAYSGTINYFLTDYTLSLSYHQLNFELQTKESVDASTARRLERFISIEDIQSKSIEVNASRDIDFENVWLSIDLGLSGIKQQANYGNRLQVKGENAHNLSRELTKQSSKSWIFSSGLSLSTLWSWKAVDFIPSAYLSYTNVIAGDDVYLFNSVTGSAKTGDRKHTKLKEREPSTGNSAVTVGSSLTTFISSNLSLDISFNRSYSDSTTADSISLGLDWEF